jgi:hypothetical protein
MDKLWRINFGDYSPTYKNTLKRKRNYIQVLVISSRSLSPPPARAKPIPSLAKNIVFCCRLEQYVESDTNFEC